MEARPPAENRHGGAPRGERPASWDAPRLTKRGPSRLANATTEIVRLSALRPPLSLRWTRSRGKTRAQQRAAGTNKTALFDIVNTATANGSCASRAPARVPGERSESRDPGATRRIAQTMRCFAILALGPGSRSACARALRCTRPGHETTGARTSVEGAEKHENARRAWSSSFPPAASSAAA